MRVHTSACRTRMEAILDRTEEGKLKRARHVDRTNELIANKISRTIVSENLDDHEEEEEDDIAPGQSAVGASRSSSSKVQRTMTREEVKEDVEEVRQQALTSGVLCPAHA